MPLFHRRDVLASLAGLTAFGGGLNVAMSSAGAEPAKKSLGKPTPPPRPKLIALDPGHGGRDPGLFLSIHADSHPDPGVRGASVYTLSEEASDREAAALAARENRADKVVSGVPLASQSDTVAKALVAMSQRGTVNNSCRLADTIVLTFGQNGVRLLPRTHRTAGFAVLTSPDIPAALVELGYLSNVQDEKLLTVRQHQLALARALRASIDAHFGAGVATRKA